MAFSSLTNKPAESGQLPTFEEAKLLLGRRPDIPGTIRKALGSENLKRLLDILTDGVILEIDALTMAGELSTESCVQYASLLPEYEEVERQVDAIVKKIVADLKPNLSSYLRASARNQKEGSVRVLYNHANNFFKLVSKDDAGYRNLMGRKAMVQFWAELFSALDDAAGTTYRPVLNRIQADLDQLWRSDQLLSFPGNDFLGEKGNYKRDLQSPVYSANLQKYAQKVPLNEAEKRKINDDMDIQFEEIKELRQYRKVYFSTHEFDGVKIGISGDDAMEKGELHPGICSFQISLTPAQKLIPPKRMIGLGGAVILDYSFRPGVLNLHFNSVTGEIAFTTNHSIPLSEIMDASQYLRLKQRLYSLILDYLKSKDPDVEDLFIDKSNNVKSERESVREQIEEALPKDNEVSSPATTEYVEPLEETHVIHEELSSALGEEVDLPLPPVPAFSNQHDKQVYLLNRIRGIKGKRVKSALTRIMGPPERIHGSHQFFRSPYNNKVFPIPIHASSTVKFPLLRACLEEWGIELEEFCEMV